ncbi:unnamed protein product [Dovyalis caffra]|uniref:Uncharacterized protein n=1 Tax=Dovyalis caffra TaxID=77055 RepID=A0AAV1QUP2_9ROSI|nr:unnamed protein product [Dovyalis caffra]
MEKAVWDFTELPEAPFTLCRKDFGIALIGLWSTFLGLKKLYGRHSGRILEQIRDPTKNGSRKKRQIVRTVNRGLFILSGLGCQKLHVVVQTPMKCLKD